jgi:hypothetical protein
MLIAPCVVESHLTSKPCIVRDPVRNRIVIHACAPLPERLTDWGALQSIKLNAASISLDHCTCCLNCRSVHGILFSSLSGLQPCRPTALTMLTCRATTIGRYSNITFMQFALYRVYFPSNPNALFSSAVHSASLQVSLQMLSGFYPKLCVDALGIVQKP